MKKLVKFKNQSGLIKVPETLGFKLNPDLQEIKFFLTSGGIRLDGELYDALSELEVKDKPSSDKLINRYLNNLNNLSTKYNKIFDKNLKDLISDIKKAEKDTFSEIEKELKK